MEQDFTYSGFFKIKEEDNGIVIVAEAEYSQYENITSYGVWFKGDLFVSADGNYVETNIMEAYEVNYSWGSFSIERAQDISNLVYIDTPRVEKTWFRLSEREYYPSNTRYIVDLTTDRRGVRRYFNHPVTLITK